MTSETILENIDDIKENLFETIESIRFSDRETEYLLYARIREILAITDLLEKLENNIEDYDNLLKIIVTKDTIIYPENLTEVKTSITDFCFDDSYDINLEGFVPHLIFFKEVENDKLKAKVKSKKQLDENFRKGYSYGDPFKLEKSKSGIYELKQGSMIGFAVKRKNVNEKENNFVRTLK